MHMIEIKSIDEVKDIQLNILLTIHKFCEQNHIKYSLACGTLLGAIRHKGFIPWDNDIDIMLLRKDYEKLMSSYPDIFENISLISLERDYRWNRAYARAYDTRTIEIEDSKGNINGIGIGIDVYPIDYVPEDLEKWNSYNRRRLWLQKIYAIKKLRWRKGRKLYKNMFMMLCQLLLQPFSQIFIAKKIDQMAQLYYDKPSKYVFENCQGISKGRKRFLSSDFDNYVEVEFEGYKVKSVANYDEYLRQDFGD